MRLPRLTIVSAWLLSWAATASLSGQEWNRFRGPDGEGIAVDCDIPVSWGEADYLWKVKLPGTGSSSPVGWEKQVYITSSNEDEGNRFVSCLNIADGSEVWKRAFSGKLYEKNPRNDFASSTPAVDKDHVYLAWTTPDEYTITALDRRTGKDAWRRDLGPFKSQHGSGASPIIFEDMLIVPDDQDGTSAVIALECATGKTRWTTPRKSAVTSYSTPMLNSTRGGPPQLILTSNALGFSSLDPWTGKVNWELPVMKYRTVDSPVAAAGLIFAACGEGGVGKQMFAVQPADPVDKQPAKVAYKVDAQLPYVVTPVARDPWIFLWNDAGIVSCLDAATGKKVWQHQVDGKYYGSPIRIGDRLYAISRQGLLVVISATGEFKLLGKTKLGEPSQSTPSVSCGVLLLRTNSHLLAVGKRPAT